MQKFKRKDKEQKKYTEGYLKKSALGMREAEKSGTKYYTFIEDFCDKAEKLIEKNVLNKYKRISLFQLTFSDKIGNKLCQRCQNDLDDPTTIMNLVFKRLK